MICLAIRTKYVDIYAIFLWETLRYILLREYCVFNIKGIVWNYIETEGNLVYL